MREAIENGELDSARFESYKKIKAEAKLADNKTDFLRQKKQWAKSLRIADKKRRKGKF